MPQSWEKAVRWYTQAAEQGMPRAQYLLGWCFENGKGVEKDLDRALHLYRQAAEQEYKEAVEAVKRLELGTLPEDKKSLNFEGKNVKPDKGKVLPKTNKGKTSGKSEKGGFLRGLFGKKDR